MTTVDLAFPPSVNNLFFNAKGKGRVKTPAYKKWQDDCGWLIKSQRPERVEGAVEVSISICPPNKVRRDIDNLIKPCLDFLVAHRIIEGDDSRFVRAVRAEWVTDQDFPCRVTVTPVRGPVSAGDPEAETGDWGSSARPALMEA